jgi:DNA-binding transcriptional LysR family regulator
MLEDELGTPLFRRTSRGVSLTEAGQRLLPYATRIAHLLAEAKRAAQDDGTPRGPLVIGTLETTAALRLSPFLSTYVAAYPDVDVTLKTGTSGELVEDVLHHRVDGAFICGPVDHPELAEEVMFDEELVLLGPPESQSLDALLGRAGLRIIVLRLGCSYRLILEAILARRGIVGLRCLEFGTLESIISCVSAGLGVTLLPRGLIGPIWQRGRVAIHALPGDEGQVKTVFVRRRDAAMSSALSAFLAQARPALRVEAAE